MLRKIRPGIPTTNLTNNVFCSKHVKLESLAFFPQIKGIRRKNDILSFLLVGQMKVVCLFHVVSLMMLYKLVLSFDRFYG